MTVNQKILLGFLFAMFIIPEILWGPLFNAAASMIGLPLHSAYYNLPFFNDYPYAAFLIIIFEIISVSGLWYLYLKLNQHSNVKRIFLSVLLAAIDISLVLLFFLNFAVSEINFP